jgi:hypothetical protein
VAEDGGADYPGTAFSRLPPAPRSSSARLTRLEAQATAAAPDGCGARWRMDSESMLEERQE